MATTTPDLSSLTRNFERLRERRSSAGGGRRVFLIGLGLLVGLMLLLMTTESIGSGQRGVKYSSFSGTNLDRVFGEGLQVMWPWEKMIVYDVRSRSHDEELEALSQNGLTIQMDVSVRYHPEPRAVPALHTALGPDFYERLVQPELRSAAREVVGHYTPEELYSTRRNELQDRIQQRLARIAAQKHIVVEAVLIRDVVLPDQIRQAIEMKLQEEQRVQQLAFTIQRETREAERLRIEAEGQAAAQRILAESITPQFLRYEGIQATRALAESQNAKVVVIGQGTDGLPLILGNP